VGALYTTDSARACTPFQLFACTGVTVRLACLLASAEHYSIYGWANHACLAAMGQHRWSQCQ
jgi:hypothetical protein